MALYQNHAGFTITGTKLQVVEVIFQNDHFYLENVDEAYFDEPLKIIENKETKIVSLLQSSLNELLIKQPLNSTTVSFALPFEIFYIAQIPYDNSLLHQDLLEEFRWELSVLFPFTSAENLVIQYLEIDKNNFSNFNSAIVYGIERKYLNILHKFCSNNNFKLKFLDNVHLASDRALFASHRQMSKGLTVSVYFGGKHLSLILIHDGKPVISKVFPLHAADEIPRLLKNEFTSENLKINKFSIDNAFISGEDLNRSLVKTLNSAVGVEFIYFNPFDKIKAVPHLLKNKFYLEKYNSFSPSAGIAYRIA